jgi:hypothetical protein
MVLEFEASRTGFASDPSKSEEWDSSLRRVSHRTPRVPSVCVNVTSRRFERVEECREEGIEGQQILGGANGKGDF